MLQRPQQIYTDKESADTGEVHLLLMLHTHTPSHSSQVPPPSFFNPDLEITNDLCPHRFLNIAQLPRRPSCFAPSEVHTPTSLHPPRAVVFFSPPLSLLRLSNFAAERMNAIRASCHYRVRPAGQSPSQSQKITDH